MNMKRTGTVLFSLMLVAASSCQAAPWDFLFKNGKADTAVEQAENRHSEAYIKNRVQAVYSDIRKNYPADHGSPPQNAVDLDKAYCSEDWNRMFQLVHKKDAKASVEVSFWYANYYWAVGQDWNALIPQDIQVTLQGDNHATVTFKMGGMDNGMKQVQLAMVYEQGGWRIDNFMAPESGLVDWKGNMREYLAE